MTRIFEDYSAAKYGRVMDTITKAEAKVFGIAYPLESGWFKVWRKAEITPEMSDKLIRVLEGQLKNKKAKRKEFARNGIAYLEGRLDPAKKADKDLESMRERVERQRAKKAKSDEYLARAARGKLDPFLSSYEWRKLRMEILKRDGARCQCCGATPADGEVMNVDHIKPRKRFPELALEPSNLQVLCGTCNHGKGNWDMTDWRAK